MAHRRAESIVPCLFEIPEPPSREAGSQCYRAAVCQLVGQALKETPKDRYQVAADMSRLSGREVSKYMLDAYAAEGREEFNLPAYLIPSLEIAAESHLLTNWLASARGGRFLIGAEALNAELGRLERVRDEAAQRIRSLKKVLGDQS